MSKSETKRARCRAWTAVAVLLVSSLALARIEPVELPALDGLPASVQDAIAEARADLARTDDSAPAIQARAWGAYGEVLHAHGLLNKASQAYRNARELAPLMLDWPYLLATIDLSEGRLDSAIALLDQVLASDGTDRAALIRRGKIYLERGELDKAAADFDRVLLLDPDSAAALGARGQVALQRDRHDEAVDYLQRAIAQAPRASALYQSLGLARRALGQTDLARAALAQAGEIEPPFADPLLARVQSRSRSPQMILEMALAQADAGNLAAAQQVLAGALSLAPEDELIIETYADISASLGDLLEARVAFSELAERRPEDPSVHFRLAQVNELAGRLDDAEAGYRRVLRLEPDSLRAREALAFVALARRQFDAAADAFERLVEVLEPAEASRLNYWQAIAQLGAGDCIGGAARLNELRRASESFDPQVMAALARASASCLDLGEDALNESFNWAELIYQDSPGMETAATLAMAYASLGLFDDAVDLQAQALFEALKLGQVEQRQDLRDDMARYRAGERAVRPFAPEHPIFGRASR